MIKKSIKYFIGLLITISLPLLFVGLNHYSRTIITPNDLFFELQIGEIPNISAEEWTLNITGAVDNEIIFDYINFTNMDSVKLIATLECVDGPFGTAEWEGIPLIEILNLAGIKESAKDLIFYAADNYSDSLNLVEASAENILLAFKMNGEILPVEHGYPIRLVCPDHYGYKWIKWIVKIEAVEYDYIGFWESRGWSDDAMRTNYKSWITHAYLFSIAFIFGGLSVVSGHKSVPKSKRYLKLPEFMNHRFHMISSLLFVFLSLISFIYWGSITLNTRGAIFYSIHGIFGLITISSVILAGLTGYIKKKNNKTFHKNISLISWYLFSMSLLIGGIISVLGTLRVNQIFLQP